MLTSWSDMSTPPELSMASVLRLPPRCPVFEARRLRQPEVAAFADDPRPHRRRVDAHAIVRAIADVGVLLGRRLDVGADAAVVEQVDLRASGCARITSSPLGASSSMPSSARASALSGIAFAERSKMPPPALMSAAS